MEPEENQNEENQNKEHDRKKEANRENAGLFTGPISPAGKERTSQNAFKHSLRSRAIKFQDEEEKANFEKLVHDLEAEHAPVGILEREMVKEIAVCIWKIAIGDGWLMDDISARRKAGAAVLDIFMNSSKARGNPFAKQEGEVRSTAQAGWDCRELIVSVSGEDAPGFADFSLDQNDKSRMQFQAKLGGSGDTILRYQNAWKRDLHRAIETLRKLQQSRKSEGKG